MPITQTSRWDDAGTEIPEAEAVYTAGEQPIAEYDNWFNKSVVNDIAALITAINAIHAIELNLGTIPLAIYTIQSGTGTASKRLKTIDNSNLFCFSFNDVPTAPDGWTLKGRLWALIATAVAGTSSITLYNITDDEYIAQVDQSGFAVGEVKKSSLFTIPDTQDLIELSAWNDNESGEWSIYGAWIELVATKD